MELIEAVATLISEHGVATVLYALLIGGLVWKGRSIMTWIIDTIRAAETVKMLMISNQELKRQLEQMAAQLQKQTEIILEQTERIAVLSTRLEQYEDHFTKRVAQKSRSKMN